MDKGQRFPVTISFEDRGQATALYNFLNGLPDCVYDGGVLGDALDVLERALYNRLPEQQAIINVLRKQLLCNANTGGPFDGLLSNPCILKAPRRAKLKRLKYLRIMFLFKTQRVKKILRLDLDRGRMHPQQAASQKYLASANANPSGAKKRVKTKTTKIFTTAKNGPVRPRKQPSHRVHHLRGENSTAVLSSRF